VDCTFRKGLDVIEGEVPPQAEFEEASSRLNQGLKSCRTVLESYRIALTGQTDGAPDQPPPALNDNVE